MRKDAQGGQPDKFQWDMTEIQWQPKGGPEIPPFPTSAGDEGEGEDDDQEPLTDTTPPADNPAGSLEAAPVAPSGLPGASSQSPLDAAEDLARWERKALSRVKEGRSPEVPFTSEAIPGDVAEITRAWLAAPDTTGADDVRTAFARARDRLGVSGLGRTAHTLITRAHHADRWKARKAHDGDHPLEGE